MNPFLGVYDGSIKEIEKTTKIEKIIDIISNIMTKDEKKSRKNECIYIYSTYIFSALSFKFGLFDPLLL